MDGIWTQFWDMHSGGSSKEKWSHIYIEAPEEEAVVIFYNRFGHNPHRVTCTCCGSDYSISSGELQELTGYHRGCKYAYISKSGNQIPEDEAFIPGRGLQGGCVGRYIEEPSDDYRGKEFIPFDEYVSSEGDNNEFGGLRLFIHEKEIKPEERVGDVPEQGYVWQD